MAHTRSNRRLEQPREQVLAATLEMVAEQGLAKVTMAALAARLGTSGGHLLYYFGTRNGLLLETLRWSEQQYAVQRAPVLEAAEAAADGAAGAAEGAAEAPSAGPAAVVAFAEVYLPLDQRDPRWLLWLELWARAPYDAELAAAQRDIDAEWHADLVRLLRAVRPAGARTAAAGDPASDPAGDPTGDLDGVSTRLRSMWDGFAIGIVTGGGADARTAALEHTRVALTRG